MISNTIILKDQGYESEYLIKFINADTEFTKARFINFVEDVAPGYEFTASTNEIIDYFINEFMKEKGKGSFILHGNTGSGKTLLTKLLFSFLHYSYLTDNKILFCSTFKIIPAFKEEDLFKNLGFRHILIVDDLGNEPILNDYGTRRNYLAEIIYRRYEMYLERNYHTIFTTNLTLKELEEYYGERIFSRLMEMCEYEKTSLAGNDRRVTNKYLKVNHSKFYEYLAIL